MEPVQSAQFAPVVPRRTSPARSADTSTCLQSISRCLICGAWWLCLVCLVWHQCPGAGAGEPVPGISPQQLQEHIRFLADPQRAGRQEEGKADARDYIVRHFQQFGLKPLFDGSWLQTVPGPKPIADQPAGPDGHNIGGFVLGSDPTLKHEWIIINAHYDHLGIRRGAIYPGADDNASGVAMLLEVARRVAAAPLQRSVAFVAFDFEESMLWGSRWFVSHSPLELQKVQLCLTADMIGRSLGGLGLETVFVMGAEHSRRVRDALRAVPVPAGLEIAQLGADMVGTRSDYGPFRDERVPFLFFSTGEHPDYHTPRDTPDRINYENAARISNLILGIARNVGNGDESPQWEPAEYQKLAEAQAVHHITQQLIDAEAAGRIDLSSAQRFFVSQVCSKTGYMCRVERVSDEERTWLTRAAQVLLLSVF